MSVVLSSHLMGDVERTCDRIIVLEGGRVVQEGTVSGFTRETQTICIEVDENRASLAAALVRRGIEPTVDGALVIVEQKSEDEADAIRDAIVEADAPLRRLAPLRHGLTDIFKGTPE